MKTRSGHRHGAIDWDLIKQRLTAAGEALEKGFAPSPEKRQEILRERARALAVKPLAAMAPGAGIEVLEFSLTQERYAVETVWVHEVTTLKELTPLPCAPPFVLGIVNLRGRIMSVIDLKKFFDLPEKGLTDLNKLIVLRNDAMKFGVLADQIIGTRYLPLAAIQAPLPTLTGIRAEYLKGITAERLVVLDGKKLLTDTSIVVEQEIL